MYAFGKEKTLMFFKGEVCWIKFLPEWCLLIIAQKKVIFSAKKYGYFSYFSIETYVVGTH